MRQNEPKQVKMHRIYDIILISRKFARRDMLVRRNRSRQGKTSEENEAVVTYGDLTESKL